MKKGVFILIILASIFVIKNIIQYKKNNNVEIVVIPYDDDINQNVDEKTLKIWSTSCLKGYEKVTNLKNKDLILNICEKIGKETIDNEDSEELIKLTGCGVGVSLANESLKPDQDLTLDLILEKFCLKD